MAVGKGRAAAMVVLWVVVERPAAETGMGVEGQATEGVYTLQARSNWENSRLLH